MISVKHSNKYITSIQRGKKLDIKDIYQHFMLSLNFPLLLLGLVLSILSPSLSNLFLLCSTPPSLLIGIGHNHSKRHKTGSEEIAAGVAVFLVALCSGNQKGQTYLRLRLSGALTDADEVNMDV